MASPTSIPLFPPWCVMPPVEKKCTLLGVTMPCVALPVNDDLFGREISLGHWVTTLLLIAIGIINLSYVSFPFQRADTMKIITSFYAIGTGIFAWLRLYFGVGHFLLMAAALHNLGEWSMLMMIAAIHTTVWQIERSILYLTFYTVAMIGFIMMMPILLVAGVVEQLAGITVDFGLVFIFLYTYLTNANKPEVRSFYFYPALAHTVHLFFTILPIVFANFHVGFTSWYNSFFLETSVYVSSPITHILYMIWSITVDKKRSEPDEKDKKGLLPSEFRVKNLKIFLGLGFLCGLITIVGVPLSLGRCPQVSNCVASREITGTSVAVVHPGFELAFEDYIDSEQLVSKAVSFKGNKGYSLLKDVINPHTYRFIERWESKEHLDDWIAQVGSKVFSQPALMNLLVGGKLQQLTGFVNPVHSSCRNTSNGGVVIDVKSTCDRVWSIISDWADCSWVIGCKYATVDHNTNVRTVHFTDGSTVDEALLKLDKTSLELVYEIVSPGPMSGYTGTINIDNSNSVGTESNGCRLLYQFSLPKTQNAMTTDVVYKDFLNNRVPALQKLFSS